MKIDGENRHKQYRVAVIDYRDICKYLLAGPGCCNSASDSAAVVVGVIVVIVVIVIVDI